jgi:transposase
MMAKTYGDDLRGRVIAAVDGGMSRTAAAARFEVGKATAIAWLRAWRDEGRSSAKPKGGDTRSHRIEAFAPVILAAVEARKDITLDELVALLDRDHGERFARSAVHRFFARRAITFKKRPRTPASRSGRTWHTGGKLGSTASPTSIPSG